MAGCGAKVNTVGVSGWVTLRPRAEWDVSDDDTEEEEEEEGGGNQWDSR